jgi:hypothetical protein
MGNFPIKILKPRRREITDEGISKDGGLYMGLSLTRRVKLPSAKAFHYFLESGHRV